VYTAPLFLITAVSLVQLKCRTLQPALHHLPRRPICFNQRRHHDQRKPSPTTNQVSLTTISLTFSPISQIQLSTLGSTLKTSTRSAGVSQTNTSLVFTSQNNSSNSNSSDREAPYNGLSAAAKAAIVIIAALAVSAAIFLAF
jgi:hypothetical protein